MMSAHELYQAAISLFAAYVTVGRVPNGQEDLWMKRCIREAKQMSDLVMKETSK